MYGVQLVVVVYSFYMTVLAMFSGDSDCGSFQLGIIYSLLACSVSFASDHMGAAY